jgi:uncharacterized membrane protein
MTIAATTTEDPPVRVLREAAHSAAIILSGILAGAVVAVLLTEVAIAGPAELWVGYHQAITGPYTLALPGIGGLALVTTVVALVRRPPRTRARLIAAALGCLVAGFAVTVLGHFPLNTEIMTWGASAPPPDWPDVRDRWLAAHVVRTVLAGVAFVLLVVAARVPSRR